ncbi:MAG: AsmA-like C-terminal region-containing protein [Verrucomicrobiota bacterium]
MPESRLARMWKIFRRMFRWCRILFLLLVLALVCLVIYVTKVGLPDFVKSRVQTELRAQGVELEFARMRLHWYRGIVAEKVTIGSSRRGDQPQFSAEEVTIRVNPEALKEFRFQPEALLIRQGLLKVPLVGTNQPHQQMLVKGIMTELNFLPDDSWELANLQGEALGLKLSLNGVLTNGPAVRQWKAPKSNGTNQASRVWQEQLRKVQETIDRMKFASPPELHLVVRGDARKPESFTANVRFTAPNAVTPWGDLENLTFTAPFNAMQDTNGLLHSDVRLRFDNAKSKWGQARQSRLNFQLAYTLTNRAPMHVDWNIALRNAKFPDAKVEFQYLSASGRTAIPADAPDTLLSDVKLTAEGLQTEWGRAQAASVSGRVNSTLTNPLPSVADVKINLTKPHTRWGHANSLKLTTQFSPAPAEVTNRVDASWGWWAKLAPYVFNWDLETEALVVEKPALQLDRLATIGSWRAPDLDLPKFEAQLYGGTLDLKTRLNVATRQASPVVELDFEVHQLAHLLKEKSRKALESVQWETPPKLRAEARLVLPSWTNREPDWKAVLPQLELKADLETANTKYQTLLFRALKTSVALTNSVAVLPDLFVAMPEGEARIGLTSDINTQEFQAKVRSTLHPGFVRPFLKGERTLKVFDYLEFGAAPWLDVEAVGRWNALAEVAGRGVVALTNFSYRGYEATRLNAAFTYANQYFVITNVAVQHGEEHITAGRVDVDIRHQHLYLTNVFSRLEPNAFARIIGPMTAKSIEPYHFLQIPTVKVNGSLPFKDSESTDLHFEVDGGPFNWWKFNLDHVTATLHWVTNTLVVTNVQAVFYEGSMAGNALFRFDAPKGTDFRYSTFITNANLHPFMKDIFSKTNKLEGQLDVELHVTSANTADWGSWNGYGSAKLEDGFLWDIPMFGIFSRVLDGVSQGLGTSRVKQGTATYTITNSLIHTKDLELDADLMRLQYRGTVDFEGAVDARVEAELFRKSWFLPRWFGVIATPFTKLLEYKVTGSLNHPKTEPLYLLPKILLAPLQPIKTIKSIFGSDKDKPKPSAEPAPEPDRKPER